MSCSSLGEAKYFMLFVDDFYSFLRIIPIRGDGPLQEILSRLKEAIDAL